MTGGEGTKRILWGGVVGVTILVASHAMAQQLPTVSWQPSQGALVSNLQLTAPWLRGEPTGTAGLSPWVSSTPLRLSLGGDIHSIGGGFANCVSLEEPSGNTINGFAVQRFASVRLAPALTLQGFSSAGCPVDGAIGGGITYTVPVGPSLWLVAAAGVYGVPAHAPFPARTTNDARLDLTKDLNGGRTLSVGVGTRGVSFGGAW
jgi:hypothetical protein